MSGSKVDRNDNEKCQDPPFTLILDRRFWTDRMILNLTINGCGYIRNVWPIFSKYILRKVQGVAQWQWQLRELHNSGGAKAPPAPPLTTALCLHICYRHTANVNQAENVAVRAR